MSVDVMHHDAIGQFRDAICAAGLTPPDKIEADGKLHRFASNGKKRDDSGWYVYHGDGVPAGAFGDWRSGIDAKWRAEIGRELTAKEIADHKRKAGAAAALREAEEKKRHTKAAGVADEIWSDARRINKDQHPYLKRKGINPLGALAYHGDDLRYKNSLVVPVAVGGNITSLQFIAPDGKKLFFPGGRVSGGSFQIWDVAAAFAIPASRPTCIVCEGFATGAAIYEALYPTMPSLMVLVAFSAGNLEAVALMERLQSFDRIICADDDIETPGNPGMTTATAVAKAAGARLAIPRFSDPRPAGVSDFCDMRQLHGDDAVIAAINDAKRVGEIDSDQSIVEPEEWIEEQVESVSEHDHGGADLLDLVRAFIARFVAFPSDHCLNAVTLWAAHAHTVEHFHTTPRLAILSIEAESGKTRTLEVLELLTPESMLIFSPSTPTIFRTLAQTQATLLFDECDTIFKKRQGEDTNEDLRALLNAGYRRGASIPRCVGPTHQVVHFDVFAAVALAGLGDLPDTILTRSIIIRMRRRTVAERVEPFRVRIHESPGHDLRDQLAEWAAEVGKAAGDAWPDLPDGIEDRQAEQWEPLIAIADMAGGEWPKRARDAAVSFVSSASTHTTLGVRLLRDLKFVFGERDAMFTADILNGLKAIEDAPWGDLRGKELDSNGLSYRLKKYGVEPRQVRIGETSKRGYVRTVEGLKDVKDGEVGLADAWARYLRRGSTLHPSMGETPETPETPEAPVSPVSPVSPYAGQGALCPHCDGEGCHWCSSTSAEI